MFKDLAAGKYAFIDVGCGTGKSISYCENVFRKGPGLGVDRKNDKIKKAQKNGFTAVCIDVTKIAFPHKCVIFSSVMDFLEHLPDQAIVERLLSILAAASKDFLFIRHPSFEDIDYLKQFNLKLAWTDWTGHRNMMTMEDFREVFSRFGWNNFTIVPKELIRDSSHNSIVPIMAPRDTIKYDHAVHGKKLFVKFDRHLYTQYDIFVRLNPKLSEEEWSSIISSTTKKSLVRKIKKVIKSAQELYSRIRIQIPR